MSQGQKPVAGGRRVGTEARHRQLAGWRAGMRRRCAVLRREARVAGVRPCGSVSIGGVGQRDKVCLIGLGRIHTPDTYQPTYPKFMKKRKNRILHRYVSAAYRIRIRIRNVSDTRYALPGTYPCNGDHL